MNAYAPNTLPSDLLGPPRACPDRPAYQADDDLPVTRIWKSDGLRRVVTLGHAASVLAQKTRVSRQRAKDSLLAGKPLETNVSVYVME